MSVSSQISALEAAIEAGVKSVVENGRTVTYHSLDSMIAAVGNLKAQQAASSGGQGFKLVPLAHGDAK